MTLTFPSSPSSSESPQAPGVGRPWFTQKIRTLRLVVHTLLTVKVYRHLCLNRIFETLLKALRSTPPVEEARGLIRKKGTVLGLIKVSAAGPSFVHFIVEVFDLTILDCRCLGVSLGPGASIPSCHLK